MTERPSPLRRAAIPLALVLGTGALLVYRAVAYRGDGDAAPTVMAEPATSPDTSGGPAAALRSAAPVTVAPRASSSSPSPRAQAGDAGPPPSPLCAPVLARNAALVEAAGTSPLDAALGSGCIATSNGAWVVRLDDWRKKGEWGGIDEFVGAWTMVHLDRAGNEIASRPGPKPIYQLAAGVDNWRIDALTTFDYDGDGEPELLVATHQHAHEDALTYAAVVATYAAGAVRELGGLPKAYEAFDDVDHDGRPDVLFFPYGYERQGALGGVYERGPSFVAHALAGGAFSVDDAIARAHVGAQCPKSPPDGGADAGHAEVCALLRGATKDQAKAVLEKECKRPDLDAGDTPGNARPGVCTDFADRESVLDQAPPLRLGP